MFLGKATADLKLCIVYGLIVGGGGVAQHPDVAMDWETKTHFVAKTYTEWHSYRSPLVPEF